jgi:hypothetical protein
MKMSDVLGLFDRVKNVKFTEFTYCKEVDADLPVFTLTEPTAEEWNKRARKQNTKMFIEIHNRHPEDYDEVLSWVYAFISEYKENHSAENTTAFAD